MNRNLTDGIRAVFFDAVGTVLHPDPGAPAVYAATASRFGLADNPAEILTRFREAFLREEETDRAAGWTTSESREVERWRTIVRDSLPGSPSECFDLLYKHFARPDAWQTSADAYSVFISLAARGLVLGLASNYDSRLDAVVAGRPELAPLAGQVVVSSRVGVRKPGVAFFDAVISAAGCRPDEILFVGDDLENDFVGATTVGMRAVLLDPRDRHPDVKPRIKELGELL